MKKGFRYAAWVLALIAALTALSGCGAPVPVPAAEPTVIPVLTQEDAAEAAVVPVPAAAGEGTPAQAQLMPESTATPVQAGVAAQEAEDTALTHAGVARTQAERLHSRLDSEDGRLVYEVDFVFEGVEYDYEIDAATGQVVKWSSERDDTPAAVQAPSASPASDGYIGKDKATEIALAKVSGATESDVRIKLDQDDGRAVYEGEIRHGGMEYDFEIDALTGKILEWDAEREDGDD